MPGSLNIFRIPKNTSQDFNGGPFYGFRVLKAGVAATIAVNDNATDPLFAGCEFHPNLGPAWRKLTVASDPNIDTLLELQTDRDHPFQGNVIAPSANVDANGNGGVVLYDVSGTANARNVGNLGSLEAVVPAGITQVNGAQAWFGVDQANPGNLITSCKAVQIFQTALANSDGSNPATYFSSTGVKGTSAIAGYDLSTYRALLLTLELTALSGASSLGLVFQLMGDSVTTTILQQVFATALTAAPGLQNCWLNRDGPIVAPTAQAAGSTPGFWASDNKPWQYVRIAMAETGTPASVAGTVTLTGFNG